MTSQVIFPCALALQGNVVFRKGFNKPPYYPTAHTHFLYQHPRISLKLPVSRHFQKSSFDFPSGELLHVLRYSMTRKHVYYEQGI